MLSKHLENICREYWGLDVFDNCRSIETMYSDICIFNEEYVIKRTNVNCPDTQSKINSFICNLFNLGFPCYEILLTRQHNSHILYLGGDSYTVYRYKKGEHLDSSKSNIYQAARLLALLHIELDGYYIEREIYPNKLECVIDQYRENILKSYVEHRSEFNLPKQVGHFDFTPTNILVQNGIISGILDFDIMRYSERARDVAIAAYKLSPDSPNLFIDKYCEVNPLSKEEICSIEDLYFDEVRRKLIYILTEERFTEERLRCQVDTIRKHDFLRDLYDKSFEF